MKNALKILSLVALTVAASMTGLSANVCGIGSNEIATLDRIMVLPDSYQLAVSVKPTASVHADFRLTYMREGGDAGPVQQRSGIRLR
jgi:hypothetical protein